jgi:hypothetical protein
VFWVGVKLGWLAFSNYTEVAWSKNHVGEMPQWLFWSVLAVIAILGTIIAIRMPDKQPPDDDCENAQELFRLRPPEASEGEIEEQ